MNDINFAWPTTAINRDDMLAFDEWFEKIGKNKAKIYIFGAGIRGSEFAYFLQLKGYIDFEFIDNNKEKCGGHIDGKRIFAVSDVISDITCGKAIILISVEMAKPIVHQLNELGLLEEKHFYQIRNKQYDNYVGEFFREIPSDHYLIFGDCMFSSVSIYDKNFSNLSEIIKEKVGYDKCKILYMHGMGIRAFYNILILYCEVVGIPRKVELMVNFETLTGTQHLMPRSQHNELFHLLLKSINNANDEFCEYVKITDSRANNSQIEISHKTKNLTKEQERAIKNRNYLRLNYMYKFNENVEGMIYFKKIVKYAKEKNIELIPFVPPVNFELGNFYFGNKFNDAYDSNLDKLKIICDDQKVRLVDLSHVFSKDYFAEKDTTDESLNESGRQIVAEKLIANLVE